MPRDASRSPRDPARLAGGRADPTPPELIGIHTNMAGVIPPELFTAAFIRSPAPAGLSDEELSTYEQLLSFFGAHVAYGLYTGTRPQTLYGLADSPIALAAFALDHGDGSGKPGIVQQVLEDRLERPSDLTRDDILDNIPTSSTTTGTTGAGTSPPGSSRSCSPKTSARRSDRCAEDDPVRTCAYALVRRPAELRGHVVLVNFWTWTCINWLRQEPHVRAFAHGYRDDGLIVIGDHTPEFAFEHDIDGVRRATKERSIDYPVAVDNDYELPEGLRLNHWALAGRMDDRCRERRTRRSRREHRLSIPRARRASGALARSS